MQERTRSSECHLLNVLDGVVHERVDIHQDRVLGEHLLAQKVKDGLAQVNPRLCDCLIFDATVCVNVRLAPCE